MSRAFMVCAVVSIFFIGHSWCDNILMTNGQSATIQIIDTNGCSVKILRRGSEASIDKKLIKRIIWKSDTIGYEGYVCGEKPKPKVRFEDTPEYKLMAIIDNAPELGQVFDTGTKIAYLISPLQGSFNADELAGIQVPLVDAFKKKAAVVFLAPEELLFEINSGRHQYDYAFVFRTYHVEISNTQADDNLLTMLTDNSKTDMEQKMRLLTRADAVLYDIRKKEIVFHKMLNAKRGIWGKKDYAWTGAPTSAEWRARMMKNQMELKLDKNAQEISRKLQDEVISYIGAEK